MTNSDLGKATSQTTGHLRSQVSPRRLRWPRGHRHSGPTPRSIHPVRASGGPGNERRPCPISTSNTGAAVRQCAWDFPGWSLYDLPAHTHGLADEDSHAVQRDTRGGLTYGRQLAVRQHRQRDFQKLRFSVFTYEHDNCCQQSRGFEHLLELLHGPHQKARTI